MNQEDDDGEPRVTGFDMVPDSRRGKLVCMIAAKTLGRPFRELYEDTPYGQVLEELALAIAAEYSPPPDDSPRGPR